jgi:hypothetical protein
MDVICKDDEDVDYLSSYNERVFYEQNRVPDHRRT